MDILAATSIAAMNIGVHIFFELMFGKLGFDHHM